MTGRERVAAALVGLRQQVGARAEEVVARCAEAALQSAREEVPVDTGRLRDSLSASVEGLSARVGTDCPYAAYVEFGTSVCAAQPFLAPALEAGRACARE